MLQYDPTPELSTDYPRFLGDHEADEPLGGACPTEYEEWLDGLRWTLAGRDDDPKASPF